MNAPFIQKLSILITTFFLFATLPVLSQTTLQDIPPSHEDLHLEPERTVELNVSEGTWMSLDLHPSGEKFVFEFMGNLFELPTTGGEATQLTHGMGFDAQPSYNPAGDKVVFISDRDGGENVWILDLETLETEKRTSGKNYRMQSPIYTPDGK